MDTPSGAAWAASPADSPTRSAIASFLAAHSTLTLATTAAGGQPMAASLFFASDDDLRLYWLSSAGSQHSLNVAGQPRAAATIHNETWSWAQIAGVQMEGTVEPLAAGLEQQAALSLYLAKFPFAAEFRPAIEHSNVYVLVPSWARWIDNGRGFGHHQEMGERK